MDYVGNIIRPPSEADSILLQVTTGCSHNKCAFCGAYMGKRFGFKDMETVRADLDWAATHLGHARRLFLCDGDVLTMPMDRLAAVMDMVREKLPRVRRIGSYANAKGLERKSVDDLARLRGMGLGVVYMGLESGHGPTLERMNKGRTPEQITEQALKVREAGIKLNVTVLLGLAGPERSLEHARATGRVLTDMDPEQAAALSLMIIPGTPLHDELKAGRFRELNQRELLVELRTMLEHMDFTRGLFLANHASNYLPLKLRLPKDKLAGLELIDKAIAGDVELRPEALRRL